MNRSVLTTVLAFSLAAPALAQSPQGKLAPSKGWHTSLDPALVQARKTGKPLMVVFRCDP